jgi:hypothetical protein
MFGRAKEVAWRRVAGAEGARVGQPQPQREGPQPACPDQYGADVGVKPKRMQLPLDKSCWREYCDGVGGDF